MVHASRGQLPAYEWDFGDVNPPVHAWAALARLQDRHAMLTATPTPTFLEEVFHKLLLNFTWWVNRKDADGGTSSRAASWGWTTSASSTAASRCPAAAAGTGRRHGLDGHVLPDMLAIALELASTIGLRRRLPPSSSSISSALPRP